MIAFVFFRNSDAHSAETFFSNFETESDESGSIVLDLDFVVGVNDSPATTLVVELERRKFAVVFCLFPPGPLVTRLVKQFYLYQRH